MAAYRRLEEFVVYQKLYRLHMPESNHRYPQTPLWRIAKTMAAALLDFLNPEPPNPET
jgi:hypothetical protein